MKTGDLSSLSFPCGGNGTCGKCKIKIESGTLPVTPADRRLLSEAELESGIRLACQAESLDGVTVTPLWRDEEEIAAIGIDSEIGAEAESEAANETEYDEGGYFSGKRRDIGVAIDIGTTTIAACLVDLTEKKIISTVTGINHQRSFGADVISRINAACSGKAEELKALVVDDINDCIGKLCAKHPDTEIMDIKKIAVCGNTTMEHLLLGYSCETLGRAPFRAVSLELTERSAAEVLGSIYCEDTVISVLPGVSVYVGADILAGICECGMDESEEVMLLVDLGTNGEMAIGNKDRILAASTAAGPAFEGGNISCGTGSIPGAISSVDIDMRTGAVIAKVIGNEEPVGLCGTGVVETVSELLKVGIIDSSGLMDEEHFEDGFEIAENIFFTQKDVRELQLAKGAVRAGIETLIDEYFAQAEGGAGADSVAGLFLAGGFGYYLKPEKAAKAGLIPEELADRTEAAGNTSLSGAVSFLTDSEYAERLERARRLCRTVELADCEGFDSLFLEKMNFDNQRKKVDK